MKKLLMIDDNPIEHLIVQKTFNKFGLFPDTTYSLSARASMEFIKQNKETENELPGVIFLDLNMPDFDGWDFLKSFKGIFGHIKKKIDIYILSSSIDPKDKLLSEEYQFVKGFINKPITVETLLNLHSKYQFDLSIAS